MFDAPVIANSCVAWNKPNRLEHIVVAGDSIPVITVRMLSNFGRRVLLIFIDSVDDGSIDDIFLPCFCLCAARGEVGVMDCSEFVTLACCFAFVCDIGIRWEWFLYKIGIAEHFWRVLRCLFVGYALFASSSTLTGQTSRCSLSIVRRVGTFVTWSRLTR